MEKEWNTVWEVFSELSGNSREPATAFNESLHYPHKHLLQHLLQHFPCYPHHYLPHSSPHNWLPLHQYNFVPQQHPQIGSNHLRS